MSADKELFHIMSGKMKELLFDKCTEVNDDDVSKIIMALEFWAMRKGGKLANVAGSALGLASMMLEDRPIDEETVVANVALSLEEYGALTEIDDGLYRLGEQYESNVRNGKIDEFILAHSLEGVMDENVKLEKFTSFRAACDAMTNQVRLHCEEEGLEWHVDNDGCFYGDYEIDYGTGHAYYGDDGCLTDEWQVYKL